MRNKFEWHSKVTIDDVPKYDDKTGRFLTKQQFCNYDDYVKIPDIPLVTKIRKSQFLRDKRYIIEDLNNGKWRLTLFDLSSYDFAEGRKTIENEIKELLGNNRRGRINLQKWFSHTQHSLHAGYLQVNFVNLSINQPTEFVISKIKKILGL